MTLADFIGIPYVSGGRDLAGLDCWGLVMMAGRELFGRVVPDYNAYTCSYDPAQVRPLFEARHIWQEVELSQATPGDVLIVSVVGYPVHAGLYLDGLRMLHTLHGCNSCIVRIDPQTNWARRIEGAYRWKGGY